MSNRSTPYLIRALEAHYEAQIHKNEAILFNYIENSAGIGEHPDIVEECVKCVDAISHNSDALERVLHIKNRIIFNTDKKPSDETDIIY